jgi:hypothetical protein
MQRPDFSKAVSPFGSVVAARFLFHLCLLLPLVPLANNHVRSLFMRPATHDAVVLMHGHVLHGAWCAGLHSTPHVTGTKADSPGILHTSMTTPVVSAWKKL